MDATKRERRQAVEDTVNSASWAVVKLLLASDIGLSALAKRAGMTRGRVEALLLNPARLSLSAISDLFLAFGQEPSLGLRRRGEWPERKAPPPAWRPMTRDVSALALVAASSPSRGFLNMETVNG